MTESDDRLRVVFDHHVVIPIGRSLYDEIVRDQATLLCRRLDAEILGGWEPWRRPDRNPFPAIDLFPRASHVVRRTVHVVHAVRQRARDVVHVARHGLDEDDGE